MDSTEWLEQWFRSQCDEDWEHTKGVSIETLDNPGWQVTVDLAGTSLEIAAHSSLLTVVGDPPSNTNGNVGGPEWMKCEIIGGQFQGSGDPLKLGAILRVLQEWITAHTRE